MKNLGKRSYEQHPIVGIARLQNFNISVFFFDNILSYVLSHEIKLTH